MKRRATAPHQVATASAVLGSGASPEKDLDVSSPEDESDLLVEIDAEDEEAIERALASVREGKGIPLDEFLEKLQRV